MKPVFTSLVFLFTFFSVHAQVAINTDGSNPDANTMLDIKSTNKGVKFPRLTTVQRKAMSVSGADAGLMVFDLDKQCLYMYNGTEWVPFAYASTSKTAIINKQTLPPDSWQARRFGWAVSIDGDYAAVSATEDTLNSTTGGGSVFIYQRINGAWTLQQRILAPDAATGDYFGHSLSMSGDDLLVGAEAKKNGNNNYQGAAYVFHRNGANWQLQQKLIAADGNAESYFGGETLIKGDTALVAARGANIGNNIKQGAVYLYTRSGTTWTQKMKLLANDGTTEARFGAGISMHGDYIAVGAYGAKTNGDAHGAVYIFVKGGNTFTQQAKVLSTTPEINGLFGCSVSLFEDYLVVGATGEYYGTAKCGTVHVYKRSGATWPHLSAHIPSKQEYDLRFGIKVLVKDGYVFITCPREQINEMRPGAVYLYRLNESMHYAGKINIPNPTGEDYFASDLDFSNGHYIMSSYWQYRDLAVSTDRGAVFFGTLD
jgi:hypothetical protein